MTDYAIQRTIMVDSQVRPSDITDRRIPRVMLAIPREAFALGRRKATAYADSHLPLGDGSLSRVLLAPRLLAKLVQSLEIAEDEVVLDIGCGTGYSTALLARLAGSVTAVEADPALAGHAAAVLEALGVSNARVVRGPHEAGAPANGPYDAILVNGTVADLPRALLDQLKDRGRLVALITDNGVGRACLWRRFAMQFDSRDLFDAGAPVLPGFEREAAFVF